MKIEKQMTDEAMLAEMGGRLARRRLEMQLTQAEVAAQAGLAKRTVERIEAGESIQMASVIRVLRVLELLDGLDGLAPETGPRPLDLLRLKGKERKRASTPRTEKPGAKEWRWGDDQ